MAPTAQHCGGGCVLAVSNNYHRNAKACHSVLQKPKLTSVRRSSCSSNNSSSSSSSRAALPRARLITAPTAAMTTSRARQLQQQQRQQAATTVRPSRPSRGATNNRVLAFRDVHRAQQLLETASEFVGYWMLGRQEGPTGRVMAGLSQMSASDVRVDIHGLLVHTQDMGPDGLARLLSSEHRPAGLSLKHWHSRVCAANEDTDTVFCLMEMHAEDEDGHPRSCYQVMKLGFLLDDTSRRVTRLLERGQWDSAGDGLTPLLLTPLIAGEEGEEEGGGGQDGGGEEEEVTGGRQHHGFRDDDRPLRTRSTRAGGEVVGSDLPVERIVAQSQVGRYTRGLNPERLRDASRAWCTARSSGSDSRSLLEPLLAPEFRLWDAYGLLPLVCSISDRIAGQEAAAAAAAYAAGSGAGAVGAVAPGATLEMSVGGGSAVVSGGCSTGTSAAPTGYSMALMMGGGGCMAPRDAVFDIIENAKSEYDVQVTPVDVAVSYTHNVVFNHWHCTMTPKGPYAATDRRGHPLAIEQECVEVDIFDNEGRLTDAWMFRDALDFEKHMMMSRRQQVAAEEERRRQRRQQRKQHQQHQQETKGRRQ